MPTLLFIEGFRFYFHSREGSEPPGFRPTELRRVRELVFEHQALFIERWHEYFADQR